jgi:hypothetical protein
MIDTLRKGENLMKHVETEKNTFAKPVYRGGHDDIAFVGHDVYICASNLERTQPFRWKRLRACPSTR